MSIAEKLATIAENEQKVYEAGKQTEQDRFWNAIQCNGTRTNYQAAFCRWDMPNISPKYAFSTITLYELLSNSSLEEFDWSKITETPYINAYAMCRNCLNLKSVDITIQPNSQTPSASFFQHTFNGATALKTIKKIISVEGLKYDHTFDGCIELENLIIDGVIAQNGFNVQWSTKLSYDSIVSIINALSDTTSGLAVTLTEDAAYNVFMDEDTGNLNDEWNSLVASKPNWTISLI